MDALTGSMSGIHGALRRQPLDRIERVDHQIEELNKLAATQRQQHPQTVLRLIEVPGIGAEAAQEILAEIGPLAAARTKGRRLESLFRRLIVRLGYVKAIWAIAHRLCRIVWNILHQGARYIEHGQAINPKAVQRCINRHLRALRRLGYQIPVPTAPATAPAMALSR